MTFGIRKSFGITRRAHGGRRAKKIQLRLGFSRQAIVSLRYFRTRPETRSKRIKQRVIRVYGLPVREVAFSVIRHKKRHRQALIPQSALQMALIAFGIVGLGYFGNSLHKPVRLDLASSPVASTRAEPIPQVFSNIMVPSRPVRLRIPNIGVDTDLTTMDRSSSGSLQMPERYDIAAWYTGSPTPGELGPSIIAGHVDSYKGPGVFIRLRELKPGDTVEVQRADNSTARFTITDLEETPKEAFPTKKVYGSIHYAGIRLITCGGAFNTQTYDYTDNIIAYGIMQ